MIREGIGRDCHIEVQAVDEFSKIQYETADSSSSITIANPLALEEGYRIVVGNDIYDQPWVQQELSKVSSTSVAFSNASMPQRVCEQEHHLFAGHLERWVTHQHALV